MLGLRMNHGVFEQVEGLLRVMSCGTTKLWKEGVSCHVMSSCLVTTSQHSHVTTSQVTLRYVKSCHVVMSCYDKSTQSCYDKSSHVTLRQVLSCRHVLLRQVNTVMLRQVKSSHVTLRQVKSS